MTATRIGKHIRASRDTVYRLLIDGSAVAQWMAPDGMSSEVHEFDAREGGAFRITLTYDDPDAAGKTFGNSDSYRGRFVMLVPGERVVQLVEFDTEDPAVSGSMTISYTLTEVNGGTDLVAVHEDLPSGLSPDENEIGWRMSLAKLAALAEA
ncbi:SRPBCC family protein [Nocardia higoensis]|uniref:SRPBCC family protein n=1 Tax=Nocardia higoensis TaxID=228599 RepID=A0ABS0DHR4_9NOCA|nr:SRPBCC family protein [Nocardia higoensis]MBF6358000.1 SRPBCC family protein [Nocardia higoensis]